MSLERLGVGTYKTTCAADTEYFGELIAPCLEDGDVLILTGGLGVGKTHFTKGVSRGLGDGHMVTSPTFALMAVHDRSRRPHAHRLPMPRPRQQPGPRSRCSAWHRYS